MPKNYCIMQIWAESGKSALPICNYSQILYQFLTFTQNLKRSQSIERSNKMLNLLNSAVDVLRSKHKHGEQYYWILYYSYLSPQQLQNTDEIIESLIPHIANISKRTYYRKRPEAVQALSSILWGYTSKDCLEMLNKFFPDN